MALAAIRGDRTVAELAGEFGIHPCRPAFPAVRCGEAPGEQMALHREKTCAEPFCPQAKTRRLGGMAAPAVRSMQQGRGGMGSRKRTGTRSSHAAATPRNGSAEPAAGLRSGPRCANGPSVLWGFLLILGITLAITLWAARRTRSARAFYTADGSLTPVQNGFALAGDWMSAAAFLGFSGLVAL